MTEHTPGPWMVRLTDHDIDVIQTAPGPGYIAAVKNWSLGQHHSESLANARLIAAAPDLHRVVEAVSARFLNSCDPLGVVALAAIAKARGETTEGKEPTK